MTALRSWWPRRRRGGRTEAVVFGNCQAPALVRMLQAHPEIEERFTFTPFADVHEIPDADVPRLHEAVARAGLVVLQLVDDRYRDGIGLGTNQLAALTGDALVLRYPSVYWTGYQPDITYLRDADGNVVVDGPFDYHDRVLLQAYADGLDAAAALRVLADPDRPSDAPARAAAATAELARRDAGCDIPVADFIAARYRDELLFHTLNHPADPLLHHMAEHVLRPLELPVAAPRRAPRNLLGATFYPLHANHVAALGLRFVRPDQLAGTGPYRIRGRTHRPNRAVDRFFAYYEQHPDLVARSLADDAPAP